jgi:dolichol-phosphate mannosyltransferase
MGVLILLKEYCGFLLPAASLIAIELSILNNFLWNDKWTFHQEKPNKLSNWTDRLILFQLVSMVGGVINFVALNVIVNMGTDYKIANILGILIAFGWNYTLNKNVTWRETYGEKNDK